MSDSLPVETQELAAALEALAEAEQIEFVQWYVDSALDSWPSLDKTLRETSDASRPITRQRIQDAFWSVYQWFAQHDAAVGVQALLELSPDMLLEPWHYDGLAMAASYVDATPALDAALRAAIYAGANCGQKPDCVVQLGDRITMQYDTTGDGFSLLIYTD